MNWVTGDGSDNYLVVEPGDSHVDGGGGRDTLAFQLPSGTSGSLRTVLGSGADTGKMLVQLVNGTDVETVFRVTVTANGGTVEALGQAAWMGTNTFTDVEDLHFYVQNEVFDPSQLAIINLHLGVQSSVYTPPFYNSGPGSDFLSGTDENHDFLFGGAGVDVMHGNGGHDILLGWTGDDALFGGDGDDSLLGLSDQGADDGGNDMLFGGNGNDYLRGHGGTNILDGGEGWDRAGYSEATSGVTVSLLLQGQAQDTGFGIDTLISIENLSGSRHNDVLIGDHGSNILWGGIGGDDLLIGNGGDDLLAIAQGDHFLDGGAGQDTVGYINSHVLMTTGVTISLANQGGAQNSGAGILTLHGIENLSGTHLGDFLTGDAANNILAGGAGNDTLNGGDGDDILYGDGSIQMAPSFLGTSGPITIFAEWLNGQAAGDDILNGGAGNDLLVGGSGQDVLTGGTGVDTFKFLSLSDSTVDAPDLITDFDARFDKIDLSEILSELPEGASFSLARKGFTGEAGEVFVSYDRSTGLTSIELDADGDGHADMLINLNGHHPSAFGLGRAAMQVPPHVELPVLGLSLGEHNIIFHT